METDWSVAAGADDPVIETGWSDTAKGSAWIDLRVDPEAQNRRIAELPEAAASPALSHALALLNAPQGMLMTTKCDRWVLDETERTELADALDGDVAPSGVGSYIDVLMTHALPMADFLLHEEWARNAARRCAAVEADQARLDLIVRPAHRDGVWGYGLTIYHYAGGEDMRLAEAAWSAALEQTIPVLIREAESLFATVNELSANAAASEDYPDRRDG